MRLEKVFVEVRSHMRTVAAANKAWTLAKEKGFDIKADKAATLRFISQFFEKKIMKKIGTIILSQAGLLKK